ncbi:hypothetical protein B0J13DRAFT_512378 [Dactylonectria estremocensis]|uniref:Uncharacterized protein n=1 Tax=Dactylonectria estremocensis TaxID=1079267 RepID=A0A9P9IJH6_9HYPO|nr:hypothetical protein B0J13DRAFT_512378 [Dactylonectria estremocensis]
MLRNPSMKTGHTESSTSLLVPARDTSVPGHSESSRDTSFWSDHPRPLVGSWTATAARSAAFLPLGAISVPFVALAISISRLNNQPKSSHGEMVLDAMGVASTLWPIAFAAVIGALVRTIALFQAERGTKLGTLEILLGSQTLVNTLKSAFTIRVFSLWTLLLAVLWTISPIGGQAVLRTISIAAHVEAQDYGLNYSPAANVGLPFNHYLWGSASTRGHQLGQIYPMFGAALSAPNALAQASNGSSPYFDTAVRQLGGAAVASVAARVDLWGNVRVPEITSLLGYRSQDPHRWIEVPSDQLVTYESLVGVPVRGMPSEAAGNLSFQLSAAYLTLECSPWFNTTAWRLETPDALFTHKSTSFNITEEDVSIGGNGSPHVYMDIPSPTHGFNFSSKDKTSKGPIIQGTLVFGSKLNSTICDMSHIYVDVDVECERQQRLGKMTCNTHRIRHSPGYKVLMPDRQMIASRGMGPSGFISSLPWLAPSYHPGDQSPFESYLADPAQGIEGVGSGITDEYTSLPLKVFAQRLALVINTALRISYHTPAVLGFSKVNLTAMTAIGSSLEFGNTTLRFTTTEDRYQVQGTWMALYILSLFLMGSCAVATIFLRLLIRAPDFLTDISALTRDSAYINIPAGGSTLSGDERARVLKDRRLRIRDVWPEQEIGYTALADDIGCQADKGLDVNSRRYA